MQDNEKIVLRSTNSHELMISVLQTKISTYVINEPNWTRNGCV